MRVKPSRPIEEQKGQVFIVVIILMLVASLLITPLLTYMYSGRIATLRNEVRMDELYAADAGIEYGIQRIKEKDVTPPLPTSVNETVSYQPLESPINGKALSPVKITFVDNATYRIQATASSTSPTSSNTTITAQVNIFYFPMFAKNAITSPTGADLKVGDNVNGIIQIPDPPDPAPSGNWTWDSSPVVGWPDEPEMIAALRDFYLSQIPPSAPHYTGPTSIPLSNNTTIGPLYVDGNLELRGQGASIGTLTGTIYVTGRLTFANKDLKLYFNNNTIYVQGQGYPAGGPLQSIDMPPGKITTVGPGCLISEEDINFQPKADSYGFLFVMSINGMIWFKPGGDFVGSLAGKTKVDMQPNCKLTNPGPPDNLNYPGGVNVENLVRRIVFWDIKLDK